MNVNTGLTALLAVQTLLAVWAWYPRDTKVTARPLVPFDQIDSIALQSASTDFGGDQLVLARADDEWRLRSVYDFPVESEPVDEIVDRLKSLKLGRPISTDPAMHKKLNVTEENYTRRVTLTSGEETLEFLAGTATRERMHVRFPGEDAVYMTHGLGAWRMSDSPRTYLPKRAMETDADQIVSFTLTNPVGTVALTKTDDLWMLPEGPAIQEDARKFVHKMSNLNIADPSDPADPDPREAPDVTVSWSLADGSTGSYFGRIQGEQLNIRLGDDSLPLFHVSSVDPQPMLLEIKAADLAAPQPEEAPE